MTKLTKAAKKEIKKAKQVLLDMIPELKAEGVLRLEIDYDGEHDEGAIQGAYLVKKGDKPDEDGNVGTETALTDGERDAALTIVYALYPGWETAGDYFIGGEGRVVLNVRTKKVTVQHYNKISTIQREPAVTV